MGTREIFQTLEFRDNNLEVLEHGPYQCVRENAWLSSGYYFWEESIESAKYWGERCCNDSYIVTKALYDITDENFFDLLGNVKHVKEFADVVKKMIDNGYLKRTSTVGHVLKFMRDHLDFKYSSCRADTSDSFSKNYMLETVNVDSLIFDEMRNRAKLKLHLVVQLCVFDFEGINFRNFEIEYEKP